MHTFQEIVAKLNEFWHKRGCVLSSPYDLEKGAGTFNPATFMRCLGPEPFRAAYIEPCRRPKDGRYGTNPVRLQHYFQYQVILKPAPYDIQDLYLESLEAMGFKLDEYDIRFVHDDWEQPTLGAWGLGWEVWVDGLESSQFTYFQAVAGIPLAPITGELTYGIERLAMHLQKVDSIYDLQWNDYLTYGDLYRRNEEEGSKYNFEYSDPSIWFRQFEDYKREALRLAKEKLPLPAYDFVIKASHAFNLLDTRGVISVSERASYIASIRDLAKAVAESYLESRKELGYPLLHKMPDIYAHPKMKGLDQPKEHEKHKTTTEPQDFLLEIGCEELPASFVTIGLQNLERQMKNLLAAKGLDYSGISVMGTPRRLAISIKDLAQGTQAQVTEKKGPSVAQCFDGNGVPTQIGQGFFKSVGIPVHSLQELEANQDPRIEFRDIKGTQYIFAKIQKESVTTTKVLQEELANIILGIDFPKKMRWAELDITFARPIRWIVALYGDEVVSFNCGPIHSGRTSLGHRQLSNGAFSISSAKEYKETLKAHKVLVDTKERLDEIERQLQEIEIRTKSTLLKRERVRQEVQHLVEWPFLTIGEFNIEFLKAPQEVLISEMVEHQKYFPMADESGKLKNTFIITANIPATDSIRRGNRRVISARLADGVFLFEQDKKKTLSEFNEKLKNILFQKGLGTVYDKVLRIKSHALVLSKIVPGTNAQCIEEAAMLSKADLATEMVHEFDELQGQMGRIYATLEGKPKEVAMAIDEHWMPRGENAPLPETLTGAIISIADKLDNLIGFFGLGLKPTSSSDPFALRRQAIGIIKIILHFKMSINLDMLCHESIVAFPQEIQAHKNEVIKEILGFILTRTKGLFIELGFAKDEIEACSAVQSDNIYDMYLRAKALHDFRKTNPFFGPLVEVHKRSHGQINGMPELTLTTELLQEIAEQELYHALEKVREPFTHAMSLRDYNTAFTLLAELQKPLAKLFDSVKILADDMNVRNTRLALLQQVAHLFSLIADFQKLQITA